MTSYLPSKLNAFKDVAQLMHDCSSSKKINVFPGINSKLGLINVIFFIIVSTSNPFSKIF